MPGLVVWQRGEAVSRGSNRRVLNSQREQPDGGARIRPRTLQRQKFSGPMAGRPVHLMGVRDGSPDPRLVSAHRNRPGQIAGRVRSLAVGRSCQTLCLQCCLPLTHDDEFVTMLPCTFRSLEKFPTQRHLLLGLQFGRSPGCENSTERDVGVSARVLPEFALMMGRSFWPKFIGMKQQELANGN